VKGKEGAPTRKQQEGAPKKELKVKAPKKKNLCCKKVEVKRW